MERTRRGIREEHDGFIYEWSGMGHGVHIYPKDKPDMEVEFFNVGDFAKDHATAREVRTQMKRWAKEHHGDKYAYNR